MQANWKLWHHWWEDEVENSIDNSQKLNKTFHRVIFSFLDIDPKHRKPDLEDTHTCTPLLLTATQVLGSRRGYKMGGVDLKCHIIQAFQKQSLTVCRTVNEA